MKPEIAIGLDIETYYDGNKDHPRGAYSLRSMSTVNYCRDNRFEFHCAAVIAPGLGINDATTFTGSETFSQFVAHLRSLEKHYTFRLVGNNSAFFDALIIKERFGYYFKKHFDVMTMAGWVYGNRLKDRKLETIAQYMDLIPDEARRTKALGLLGLPPDTEGRKISAALSAVKGLTLNRIRENPALLQAYTIYCEQDALFSWQAYHKLQPLISQETMDVADLYYRAYLDMPLQIDVPLLSSLKDNYQQDRQDIIEAFGAALPDGVTWDGLKTIRSKDKFAQLLRGLGVPDSEVPTKPGKADAEGNPHTIYAFDKTSMALDDLAAQYDDGESLVPEACKIRLEYNSSNTEGKLTKFALAGASGPWAFHVKPFAALNTARHSGGSGTGSSGQNLSRAKPCFYPQGCKIPIRWAEQTSVRDAIGVPEGYELVVADLSGIELRCNLTIANDQRYIKILQDPMQDVYCTTASELFGKPVTKKDKAERFVGKLAELSLGYLTGWRKLHMTARLWGSPIEQHIAQLAHATYRQSHPAVVETWAYYEDLLERWAGGSVVNEQFGVFWMEQKGIRTPSGFLIQFPDLQMEWKKLGRSSVRAFSYWNASRRCRVNVHSGLTHENLCQASAAQVFNDMHLRIQPRAEEIGGVFVTSVHDELLYRVPVGKGSEMLGMMYDEMSKPPVWWPELPVTAEGDSGFGILEHNDTFNVVSRYGMLK